MPGRDGRGPVGMGPMSGRGMGLCVGVASGVGSGMRLGRGMGYGGGFGCGYGNRGQRSFGYGGRFGFPAPMDARDEEEWLRSEEQLLNRNLRNIRDRLSLLSGDSDAKG